MLAQSFDKDCTKAKAALLIQQAVIPNNQITT